MSSYEDENVQESLKPSKYYSGKPMYVLSFFFGPFVGTYMLSKNEKMLGNDKRSKQFLVGGFIFSVLIIYLLNFIYEFFDYGLLRFLIPLSYSIIIKLFFDKTQEDRIPENAVGYSWYYYVIASIISVVLFIIVLIFAVAHIDYFMSVWNSYFGK